MRRKANGMDGCDKGETRSARGVSAFVRTYLGKNGQFGIRRSGEDLDADLVS